MKQKLLLTAAIILIINFQFLAQNSTCFKGYPNCMTNYGLGGNPTSIAVGDLNADGKPDLAYAVANAGSSNISILLNNGNGTYATAVSYPSGINPSSIAIGDINGDGFPDIAFTNHDDNDVSIMLNTGTGTFSSRVNYNVGQNTTSVAIGDLNGDGFPDLVVTSYFWNGSFSTNNIVSVFMNTGTGTFATQVDYVVGSQPESVSIGDLNMDGHPDLVVANYGSNNVSVLTNNGSGTFLAAVNYPAGTNPQSLTIGDINGDGKLDVAVVNTGTNNVSILKNNGTGILLAPVNYSTGTWPYSVAIGDLNGDGFPDLAVTNKGSKNFSVLNNTGSGTFTSAVNYPLNNANSTPVCVVMSDLNGDGKKDLAIADYSASRISILNNDGKGTFTSTTIIACLGYSVAIGDLNGDGYNDLAVVDNGVNVSVMLNTGSGTFAAAVKYVVGSAACSVAIGDLNGDGLPDLAVANNVGGGTPSFSILLNTGNGVFSAAVNYITTRPPYNISIGDLNGDGFNDIVCAISSSTGIEIHFNNGNGTFAAAVGSGSANGNPSSAAIADLNHDGHLDIVVANSGSSNISVLLNNGTGTFAAPVNYPSGTNPSGPSSVAIGDLNGDGFPDLVVANGNSNNVSVLKNSGTGTFTSVGNYTVGLNPTCVVIGDLNGDNIPDIATANNNTAGNGGSYVNTYSILLNNGSGTFATAENHIIGYHPRSIGIGDLNGDGKSDIVVTDDYNSNVSVLMNYTAKIIASGPTSFCQGGSVTFTVNNTGTYLWSTGATSQSITVNSTQYDTVVFTNANGCSNTATAFVNVIQSNFANLPFSEGFEGATFVPTNWTLYNPDANVTWARNTSVGGFGTSSSSAMMDNFTGPNDITGQKDALRTPKFNLSNAITANLKFDVAHARYSPSSIDSLNVYVTTNCGSSWSKIYGKGGTSLATAPDQGAPFTPTSSQWRTETINLASYIGQSNVQFSFENKSGYGQFLYLDNINITGTFNPNCIAHYTTSYDSLQNNFTLTVDPATTAMAVTYNWNFGDGTTSTLPNPSHTYTLDTVYNVCMKIQTAIGDTCSYCHVIGKDYLGNIYRNTGFTINVHNGITTDVSKNLSDKGEIEIYPNPTNGIFNLQLSKFENAEVKIYNVLGECIHQQKCTSANQQIDLTNQSNGIYFINIKTEEGIVSKKIIINK